MTRSDYQRVDMQRIDNHLGESSDTSPERTDSDQDVSRKPVPRVRLGVILPLSLLLCAGQAVISITIMNVVGVPLDSTLIPVVGFAVLCFLVLLVNPVLRLFGRNRFMRPLNRVELLCVFTAMLVSSGIATFGLTLQLVPLIATPWNPEWNTAQRGWAEGLLDNLNPSLYITDPEIIRAFRSGVDVPPPPPSATWSDYLAYYAAVFRAVPWTAWIRPIGYWLIFVAGVYGLFYCLTYLVLDYWSRREKLIFPLAQLGRAVLPEGNGQPGRIPELFRRGAFWLGFCVIFGILSWNGAVAAKWLGALTAIPMGMTISSVNTLLAGSPLEGLTGLAGEYSLCFLIFFTAIGIAFLLPLEITFSLWFYFLMAKLLLLIAVWMGYGKTVSDFPSDWLWQNNPISAQGAGGILCFSAISLIRCIREYAHLSFAAGMKLRQRLRVAQPVIGLTVCLIILTVWLHWNRMPIGWALVIVALLTLMTIGLMRIVAESGMYWFQVHCSFFHIHKMLAIGGWGKIAFLPALIGPLLLIYSVLFLDLKTFLAPNLLNAARMHQDTARHSRAKFHINLLLCLLVTVVVALGFAIFLAHLRGAQLMNAWFFSLGPLRAMETAQRASEAQPEFQPFTTIWYGIGAVWVALSIFLRRILFWFPHPIGYIMLVNPLIVQLWFSFFIGWVCKKIVVKYGGKATFDKVRSLFIGMILGELLAIFFWQILGISLGFKPGLHLNRY